MANGSAADVAGLQRGHTASLIRFQAGFSIGTILKYVRPWDVDDWQNGILKRPADRVPDGSVSPLRPSHEAPAVPQCRHSLTWVRQRWPELARPTRRGPSDAALLTVRPAVMPVLRLAGPLASSQVHIRAVPASHVGPHEDSQ